MSRLWIQDILGFRVSGVGFRDKERFRVSGFGFREGQQTIRLPLRVKLSPQMKHKFQCYLGRGK